MKILIDRLWDSFARILRSIIYKVLKIRMSEDAFCGLLQFVKFSIVGVTNNLVYYLVFIVCENVGMHYTLSNLVGFFISVLNSFYWNNKYVFVSDDKRSWWKSLLKTFLCYAFTGIVLNSILLYILIDRMDFSTYAAPLLALVVTVPLNYFLNRYWAFGSK